MNHRKKMIAPIIISLLIVLYYLGIGIALFLYPEISRWVKILIILLTLCYSGVMIGVLISRIKEIRSGEEDDLSKY